MERKCQYQPLDVENSTNQHFDDHLDVGSYQESRATSVLRRYCHYSYSICLVPKKGALRSAWIVIISLVFGCAFLGSLFLENNNSKSAASVPRNADRDHTFVVLAGDEWTLTLAEQVDFRGNASLMADCIVGKYRYDYWDSKNKQQHALVGSYLCDNWNDDDLYAAMVDQWRDIGGAVYEGQFQIAGSNRKATIVDIQPGTPNSMFWQFVAVWQEDVRESSATLPNTNCIWIIKYDCSVNGCTKEDFETFVQTSLRKASFQSFVFPPETLTRREANQRMVELLQDMPIPDWFEKPPIATDILLRYHLNVILCNAVGLAWIKTLQDSVRHRNETSATRARDALATYRDWPVFAKLNAVENDSCARAFQETIDGILGRDKLTKNDMEVDTINHNWCLNDVFWA